MWRIHGRFPSASRSPDGECARDFGIAIGSMGGMLHTAQAETKKLGMKKIDRALCKQETRACLTSKPGSENDKNEGVVG